MKSKIIIPLLITITCILIATQFDFSPLTETSKTGFKVYRIAHAGGGINETTYTNSYEALNHNYKKGFRYFEIDFVFTKDNQLVCLHDWGKNFEQSFGFETESKVTFLEFEKLVDNSQIYTNCTLLGLGEWMKEHPNSFLITDVKGKKIDALEQIANVIPDARKRVIPQMYQPENFNYIKSLGFENVIWTLYRYSGDKGEVLTWVDKLTGSFAITMPKSRLKSGLAKALKKKNIPSYVHTVNKASEFERYKKKFGITEIYTDFLFPVD